MRPDTKVIDADVRRNGEMAWGVGLHACDQPGCNCGATLLALLDQDLQVFAGVPLTPDQADALARELVNAARAGRAIQSGHRGEA